MQNEIRNGNRYGFTMIPNDVIRGGYNPRYLAVLLVIASHGGDSGTCFASNATIAKEAGVKRHMVIEAIKFWEELGGLSVERRKGYTTIISTRFEFSAKMGCARNGTGGYAESGIGGVPETAQGGMPKVAYKEEHLKKTPLRRHNTVIAAPDGAGYKVIEVKNLLECFTNVLNPNLNLKSKPQYDAMVFLYRKHGEMRLLEIIDYCARIRQEKYAPIITTPLQLMAKEAQLAVFFEKQTKKPFNKDADLRPQRATHCDTCFVAPCVCS